MKELVFKYLTFNYRFISKNNIYLLKIDTRENVLWGVVYRNIRDIFYLNRDDAKYYLDSWTRQEYENKKELNCYKKYAYKRLIRKRDISL